MAAISHTRIIQAPPTASDFAIWARLYDEQPNPLLSLEERFLAELLPDVHGLTVLDVGCGTGRWLTQLRGKGAQRLIGVDPSPEMLDCAASKLAGAAELLPGTATALPVDAASVDVVLASFVLSYIDDLPAFVRELCRIARPEAKVFVSDMHPHTMLSCGWKRGFRAGSQSVRLSTAIHSLKTVGSVFEVSGFRVVCLLEPPFGEAEKRALRSQGKSAEMEAAEDRPAIYMLQCEGSRRQTPAVVAGDGPPRLRLCHANVALGPDQAALAVIHVDGGRISAIRSSEILPLGCGACPPEEVDLRGYLLLPGLINSHDHLEFGLYPNLGNGPYRNYLDWASDIQRNHAQVIERQQRIPKAVRLWWGGIRNLLCGVTSVCHHNPVDPVLLTPDFPVRIISSSWAHSLALDPHAVAKYNATPPDQAFVIHAAEGYDRTSARELPELERLGVLSPRTVVVHGLALDNNAIALMNRREACLVWCPTSNEFLFHRTHDRSLLNSLDNVLLGSDSPLTAAGDLLDELRFAHGAMKVDAASLFHMITDRAARVFRLRSGQGTLRPGVVADIIAVRDSRELPAQRLVTLSMADVELVVRAGTVRLASSTVFDRLPNQLREGLRPIEVAGHLRWLRASTGRLCGEAQDILGCEIHVGGKRVQHVCSAWLH